MSDEKKTDEKKTAKKVPVEGDTRCAGCGDQIKTGGDDWQWEVTDAGRVYYIEDVCADEDGNALPYNR